MPNTTHLAGATSKIITMRGWVISTGLPYTAGVYNTSGLVAHYTRDGGTQQTITLVTATAGTYTSSGFVHRGDGEYELGAPTAALATGADGVRFSCSGVTDVVFELVRVELVGVDPRSAVAPDVNVTKIASQTASASGTVTFPNATLASTTNITAGTITTATNLTNAPTAGDLTATMKTSVTTAVPTAVQVADAMLARNAAGGANSAPTVSTLLLANDLKFSISGTTLTVFAHDGVTVLFTRTISRAAVNALISAA